MNLCRPKRSYPYSVLAAGVFALCLCSTSCKSVARENILVGINQTIGVSLDQDEKSQMFQAQIGYVRSQSYSIPTGKIVPEGECGATNEADKTPEVLSAIKMEAGIKQFFVGLEVAEVFAVGKEAVKSDAATALFIANASTDKNAEQAAKAAPLGAGVESLERQGMLNAMFGYTLDNEGNDVASKVTVLDAVVSDSTSYETFSDLQEKSSDDEVKRAYRAMGPLLRK